jgi:uncharacterized protein (UPF0333 family)
MTGARGQASVEVLALLPLVASVALIAMTFMASHSASEQAGEAAEAGALAVLQSGDDARAAARAALPKRMRERATITVHGNRVSVRVRPRVVFPIPGLSERLAGTAHADTGPGS